MSRKTALVVGATGLVGHAAMKHFSADPDCDIIAVSRRPPDETFGARYIAVDLTDAHGTALATASDYLGELHRLRVALRERESLAAGGSRFVYSLAL